MKKIWFKTKTYGWGWTPITWEGWLMVFLYVIAVVGSLHYFLTHPILSQYDYRAPITFCAFTTLLILVSFARGEKPGWNWGDKDKDH